MIGQNGNSGLFSSAISTAAATATTITQSLIHVQYMR